MKAILTALLIITAGDFHVRGNPTRDGVYPSILNTPLFIKMRRNIISPSIEFSLRKARVQYASPFYYEDRLYFLSKNGDIYRYYDDNLKLIISLGVEVIASPETFDEKVFVVAGSGDLFIIDVCKETMLLSLKPLSPPVFISPLLTPYGLFVTSSEGEVLRLTFSGKIEKVFQTDTLEKIFSNKAIAFDSVKKRLFFVDGNGVVYALNTELRELWRKNVEGPLFRVVVVPEKNMVITGATYKLGFYREEDGNKINELFIKDGISDFAVYKEKIYIATNDGRIVVVNMTNSKVERGIRYGNKKEIAIISLSKDGKIVIGSSNGRLVVMNSRLEILERIKVEGGIHAEPVIWNGHIAAITDRGEAYVFGPR